MRWNARQAVPLVCLATASAAVAGAGLELTDGRVLEGVAVERAEDGYRLALGSGARIVIPAALVREVRLIVEPVAVFGPQPAILARGAVDPSWQPGSDWRQDLVANESEPSSWERPPIGSRWRLRSSFDPAVDSGLSRFARWVRPPVGSTWRPRDGFPDVGAGSESD